MIDHHVPRRVEEARRNTLVTLGMFLAAFLGGAVGYTLNKPEPGTAGHTTPAVFYSGNARCVDYPEAYITCEDGRIFRLVDKP